MPNLNSALFTDGNESDFTELYVLRLPPVPLILGRAKHIHTALALRI